MQSSTLEQYVDIIKTLMEHGSLNIHEFEPFLKVNASSLKERINFLVEQGLVKAKESNHIVTYTITERGTKVLRFFKIQTLMKVRVEKP